MSISDPDPQLEREADEAATEALSGEEPLVVNRMGTDVHVQRYPGEGVVAKAGTLLENGTEKVDDATRKRYRLSKEQLLDVVTSVETPAGLSEWLEYHDIDVASRVQDAASSPIKGMTKGWTVGSAVGAIAGPAGAVAGGLAGVPLGAVLTTKFGQHVAGEVQSLLRDRLGLNTDQEFDLADDTGSYSEKINF
ncbi:DUF4157 domain-containing protein [Natrinema pallidum]|uniref:DUF4157 domain-containing protein n=1 Tax=Natrinema pallidum TaxID=69527 RepID=UPI001EE9291F|nr:DUF4157 domain-containing protein [Natrinema pallidum]